MKDSAGTVLWRRNGDSLEVLIVHPSGIYNRNAPWGVPKGMPAPGESLEETARRETREETGVEPGELVALGFADNIKSRKRIHCWGGEAPADAEPRCASWEVDRVEFVPLDRARELMHPLQAIFLDRLLLAVQKS